MRQPKVFNATKLDPAVERSQTRWFEKENLPDQLGDGSRLPPSSGERTGTETGFVPTSSVKGTKKNASDAHLPHSQGNTHNQRDEGTGKHHSAISNRNKKRKPAIRSVRKRNKEQPFLGGG